jgi:hypothetical protein
MQEGPGFAYARICELANDNSSGPVESGPEAVARAVAGFFSDWAQANFCEIAFPSKIGGQIADEGARRVLSE